MANTVKQGSEGQVIEQQGSVFVRGSLRIWNGTAFIEVSTSDEIGAGSVTVATYADMIAIVQDSISNAGTKPFIFLVLEDEEKDQTHTTYNFYPDEVTPANSVLQWAASIKEDI